MTGRRLVALAAIAVVGGCSHAAGPPAADAIRALDRIGIVVAEEGEFTVSGAGSSLEGARALGLTGVAATAVASAADAATDREATESLASKLGEPACRARFEAALEQTLRASGRLEPTPLRDVAQARSAEVDGIAVFAIDSCGFLRLEEGAMVAFVALSGSLERPDAEAIWRDRQTVIATTGLSLEQLLSQPEVARRSFEQVLADAGRRMANELLYPRAGDR